MFLVTTTGITVPTLLEGDGTWEVRTPCAETSSLSASDVAAEYTGAHIVIDPGHGGEETGSVGPAGLVEADLNLDIAQRLAAVLRDQGLTVVLTREADYRSTLQTRAEVANALQPLLFVSIHHNGGFPEPSDEPGTEIYFKSDLPRFGTARRSAVRRAGSCADAAGGNLDGHRFAGAQWRLNTEGEDAYGIIRRADNVATALTEALFLSSEAEEQLLENPEVRQLEAIALSRAIVRYLDTDESGSGVRDGVIFEGQLSSTGGPEGCIDPALQ